MPVNRYPCAPPTPFEASEPHGCKRRASSWVTNARVSQRRLSHYPRLRTRGSLRYAVDRENESSRFPLLLKAWKTVLTKVSFRSGSPFFSVTTHLTCTIRRPFPMRV